MFTHNEEMFNKIYEIKDTKKAIAKSKYYSHKRRKDWKDVRMRVMYKGVIEKFKQNEKVRDIL